MTETLASLLYVNTFDKTKLQWTLYVPSGRKLMILVIIVTVTVIMILMMTIVSGVIRGTARARALRASDFRGQASIASGGRVGVRPRVYPSRPVSLTPTQASRAARGST